MRLFDWLASKIQRISPRYVDGLMPSASANAFCPKLASILASNPCSVPFREAGDYFLKLNRDEQRLVLSKIQYGVNNGSFNPVSTLALWCVIEDLSAQYLHLEYPDSFGAPRKLDRDTAGADSQAHRAMMSVHELATLHAIAEARARIGQCRRS